MPKKTNRGGMYVFPTRRNDFQVQVPTVWDETQIKSAYFAANRYRNPKLVAHAWVTKFLQSYYGASRADYIQSIPQFVKKMKFGCGVRTYKGVRTCRYEHKRPKIVIYWSVLSSDGQGRMITKRKQTSLLYNESNELEREHEASLIVARLRAETTFSNLSDEVFNFEYDLDFIRGN